MCFYTRLLLSVYFIKYVYLLLIFFGLILFDPGRCYCYWDSIKPCKSNEFRLVAYGSVTRG